MAYGEGADPRNATLKTGTVVYGPGKIMTMDSTNNTLDLSDVTEIGLGISAGDSSRTAAKVLQTAAGATVSYYPLGGMLMVQSEAAVTYTTGLTVYVGASGLATATAGSNKKLGLYVGEGQTTDALVDNGAGDSTATEGTMIPVATAGAEIA